MRSARPKTRETNPHRQQNERRDYVFKRPPPIYSIAQPRGQTTASENGDIRTLPDCLGHRRHLAERAGHFFPAVFHAIGWAEIAKVNLPVAVLIWLMIIPILVKTIRGVVRLKEHWRGIGVTLFINWAVKPFSMAVRLALRMAVQAISSCGSDKHPSPARSCSRQRITTIVFVWSRFLATTFQAGRSQRRIMVFAFAPIVGLLLGISAITVPWKTLFLSVVLYIVVPVICANHPAARARDRGRQGTHKAFVRAAADLSGGVARHVSASVWLQGEQIMAQPLIIAMLAVPILIRVYFNSGLAYVLNRAAGEAHCVAGPSALIGASNFFELAVAAAIISSASTQARHSRPVGFSSTFR